MIECICATLKIRLIALLFMFFVLFFIIILLFNRIHIAHEHILVVYVCKVEKENDHLKSTTGRDIICLLTSHFNKQYINIHTFRNL